VLSSLRMSSRRACRRLSSRIFDPVFASTQWPPRLRGVLEAEFQSTGRRSPRSRPRRALRARRGRPHRTRRAPLCRAPPSSLVRNSVSLENAVQLYKYEQHRSIEVWLIQSYSSDTIMQCDSDRDHQDRRRRKKRLEHEVPREDTSSASYLPNLTSFFARGGLARPRPDVRP
jgi:hypothetical protein